MTHPIFNFIEKIDNSWIDKALNHVVSPGTTLDQ